MRSFVIFSVMDQSYGISIENVKRILPAQALTEMPDEGSHIEGMFQYEDDVLKVLSFRKAIGEYSYAEKLNEMFPVFKDQLKAWLDALKQSVKKEEPFNETTNPHESPLGKWIDSFHADDQELLNRMKTLKQHHQDLHLSAIDLLNKKEASVDERKAYIKESVNPIYKKTVRALEKVAAITDKVAAQLQRCLIFEDQEGSLFGVNIDEVDDIVHVEEDTFHEAKEKQSMGDYINIAGILTHDEKLVTVIKDIRLNKRSA